MTADDQEEKLLQEAYAQVPSGLHRGGELSIRSYQLTVTELESLKIALENPPKKPDVLGAAVSSLTAAFFLCKTLYEMLKSGGNLPGPDLFLCFVAVSLIVFLWGRYLHQSREKDPHHAKVLEHVTNLLKISKAAVPPVEVVALAVEEKPLQLSTKID